MNGRRFPAWMKKAREFAARVPSPVGRPFAAAKRGGVAEIYIYEAIGRDDFFQSNGIAPEDIVAAVKDAKGADELAIHVNSPGGFVFDGVTIYNAIRSFGGKRTVYVDGLAASIASIIALAGDRVVTNEGALWMIHDPSGGVLSFGTADQIEDDARKTVNELRKIRETLLDIYINNTGQTMSDLSAWMAAETWMTAAEAKARGFTDEIAMTEPAPEEDASTQRPVAAAPRMPPADIASLARIKRRELEAKFSGASPGKTGEPVPNHQASEKKR